MKANQKFVNGDDAVSPVIAVILMVAITVVLAATVYLWVSGFGNQTQNVVQATFAAKAVDLPGALCTGTAPNGCPPSSGTGATDSDSQDDSIQITYTAGQADLSSSEVYITIDGLKLSPATTTTAVNGFADVITSGSPTTAVKYCTNLPAGVSTVGSTGVFTWARGSSLYLWHTDGATGCNYFQSGTSGLKGTHNLQIVGKNQVLLDTQIEVHE